MPYETYKIIHVLSAFFLFAVAGGVALFTANGGTKENNSLRKLAGILHGLALVGLLVAGFGLLARLGIGSIPGWVFAKLVLWLLLGGILTLPYKKPELGKLFFWLIPLLGGVAAVLAIYKPF
jgi:hypothetical protein